MSKTVFICDLDGVIFDSTARFHQSRKATGKIDWQIALDPQQLHLDTIIEGAIDDIDILEGCGDIVLLTSRPQVLASGSEEMLSNHNITHQLICKPNEAQYVRSSTWKAHEVSKIATSGYNRVIFIDDAINNREAVDALELDNVICCESLSAAVMSERFSMYSQISNERTEVALYPHLPCISCLIATYRGVIQLNHGEWHVIARCNICQAKLDGLPEPPRERDNDGPALML